MIKKISNENVTINPKNTGTGFLLVLLLLLTRYVLNLCREFPGISEIPLGIPGNV